MITTASMSLALFYSNIAIAKGFPLQGSNIYQGTYQCSQGLTPFEIDATGIGYGLPGKFIFGGGRIPLGEFEFQVQHLYDDNFRLIPIRWVKQPYNYGMIPIDVQIINGRLTGRIQMQGCGSIEGTLTSASITKNTIQASSDPEQQKVLTLLADVLREDALHWGWNTLDSTVPVYLDRTSNSVNRDEKIGYTYSGGKSGWMIGRFNSNGQLECIIFHDEGLCRQPRTRKQYQAWVDAREAKRKKELAIMSIYYVKELPNTPEQRCIEQSNSIDNLTQMVEIYEGNTLKDIQHEDAGSVIHVAYQNVCKRPIKVQEQTRNPLIGWQNVGFGERVIKPGEKREFRSSTVSRDARVLVVP
ncbi:hypothetical protein [Sphingomonas sp. 35-24ZXX]|uniref:hypothetical protein n=1 Tax=Sphingomonas sp. 35-24ZXX TaxID=1545915 RepID=UPI0012E0854A|nr:hypothetical protein [Sphingomonas sp. 35-24ZXX]